MKSQVYLKRNKKVEELNTQPASLTRTEIDWLNDKFDYLIDMKARLIAISEKLKIFNEFELPL